ncbi:enoyl-CoA hydratase/isomerase family protein [Pacificimonas sp. WHA3]|uniref:Enoyl-CoA hydratase/isomerase family protein n=1 Tax=Pacificimonas pallii TaxID=2827236 RepID=A0ABS6SDN8_9SPHN|nr:enoyl-CoA hydratase-related protein [Pacificimonas pallii]MBV7255962.1 enoyl-CoA hydratase/isomerase family protein [Pacificimonas pallii]
MSEPVLYESADRIARITLNRPDTRNALSDDVVPALINAVLRAEEDTDISCVILTGAGKSFSAGGNLNEIRKLSEENSALEIAEWYRTGIQRIPLAFESLSVPVIAAVNGHAIGAGLDVATMCDVRIAGESAKFAESFVRVGLIPGDGGAWLLPRTIGHARAMHMLLTSEAVDAATALDWGLVTDVAADDALLARAEALAASIAAQPPVTLRKAKRLMITARNASLSENLEEARLVQGVLQKTGDHREAVTAILEKRKPSFS